MKKAYFLIVFCAFLLSGCAINFQTGEGVIFTVKEAEYKVSAANPVADVDFKIKNNSESTIYYEDLICGTPFKLYQLVTDTQWKVRPELAVGCMGIAPGPDNPQVLKVGRSVDSSGWGNEVKKGVSGAGTYKMEFSYYLTKEDYASRRASQSVFSNQFVVSQDGATKESVISTCKREDARESRLVECLYVSAKNVATQNAALAIDLCREIEKFNYNFDACYDGVALMLQRGGQADKAKEACDNHIDPARAKRCLDSAIRFE